MPRRYKSGPKKGQFMSKRAIAAQKAAKKRRPAKKTSAKKRPTKGKSMKKSKGKSKGRRRSPGRALSTGKRKAEIAGAGMAFGYVEQMPDSMLASVPQIQALGFDGTMALALHFGAKAVGKGFAAKLLDRGAEAYAGSFGLEFGRGGLKMAGDQLGHGGHGRPAVVGGSVRYDEAAAALEHGE